MFSAIAWFLGALLFSLLSWVVGIEDRLTIVLFALLGGEITKLIYVLIEAKFLFETGGLIPNSFRWLATLSLRPSVLSNGLSVLAGFMVHFGFGWGFLGTFLTYIIVDISTLIITFLAVRFFLFRLSDSAESKVMEKSNDIGGI